MLHIIITVPDGINPGKSLKNHEYLQNISVSTIIKKENSACLLKNDRYLSWSLSSFFIMGDYKYKDRGFIYCRKSNKNHFIIQSFYTMMKIFVFLPRSIHIFHTDDFLLNFFFCFYLGQFRYTVYILFFDFISLSIFCVLFLWTN